MIDFMVVGKDATAAKNNNIILEHNNKKYTAFIKRTHGFGLNQKKIKTIPMDQNEQEITFWLAYKKIHTESFNENVFDLSDHLEILHRALNHFEENGALTTCEANHMREKNLTYSRKRRCGID